MKIKIYIAGPMRGIPYFNSMEFFRVGRILERNGFETFNPAVQDVGAYGPEVHNSPTGKLSDLPDFDLGSTMGEDCEYICNHADAVLVLDGWTKSTGAKIEVQLARMLDKPVLKLVSVDPLKFCQLEKLHMNVMGVEWGPCEA